MIPAAIFLTVALVPLFVIAVRERRERARFQAALDEERKETAIRYAGDDEITERRQSYSAWPWEHR